MKFFAEAGAFAADGDDVPLFDRPASASGRRLRKGELLRTEGIVGPAVAHEEDKVYESVEREGEYIEIAVQAG